MTILTHKFQSVYTNKLIDEAKEIFEAIVDPTNQTYTIRNYSNSVETISKVLEEL